MPFGSFYGPLHPHYGIPTMPEEASIHEISLHFHMFTMKISPVYENSGELKKKYQLHGFLRSICVHKYK